MDYLLAKHFLQFFADLAAPLEGALADGIALPALLV